ncbi:MAG: hypothetical protein IJ753_04465 [Bacteroidales bacterium]|nr:hypothetical protein [Bacteroidales bacterium]
MNRNRSHEPGIWGLRLDKYQVHARFILLDTLTGYRSQYQRDATVMKVR